MLSGILSVLSLVVAIWMFPSIWFLFIKNQIDLDIRFEPRYVVVGDAVRVHCVIKNKSWLPCPFVEISIHLPRGLSASPSTDKNFMIFKTTLKPLTEMEVISTCYAVRRGFQQFENHPVYVRINEGLGLRVLILSKSAQSHLTVMPSFTDQTDRKLELRNLSGSIEQFHWLHPDESLLRGIREYQLGDPFKYIAWQASAASGKWMVKQFSASTEAVVCLILNAQMFDDYWSGARHDEFDRLSEMVTTYASQLQARGFELKFATNAVWHINPNKSYFGRQSASSIRVVLGELSPYASTEFISLWKAYTEIAPVSETVLIFTSYEGPEWQYLLDTERRKGRYTEVIWGPDPILLNP